MDSEAKQQRSLAGVAVALFVTAAGILGSFLYLQQPRFAPRTEGMQGLDPVSQEKKRKANIAQATVLREHWRAWAERHKDVMTEMRHGKGSPADIAVFMNDNLPDSRSNGLPYSVMKTNDTQFTWQPRGSKAYLTHVKNPKSLPSLQKERQVIEKQFEEGLSKYKDVIISRSVNVGPTLISLWASGRVTVSTSHDVREGRGYVSKDGEPEEIQPPFEFAR